MKPSVVGSSRAKSWPRSEAGTHDFFQLPLPPTRSNSHRLILVALPPFAVWFSGRSLLENLFVLDAGNIFWVMIVALMLAWSLLVVSRLVLLNGQERFAIDQWMKEDTLTLWQLIWSSLPAMSVFDCVYWWRKNVSSVRCHGGSGSPRLPEEL